MGQEFVHIWYTDRGERVAGGGAFRKDTTRHKEEKNR